MDTRAGDVDPGTRTTITVYLRPAAVVEPGDQPLSRDEFAARHSSRIEDVQAVEAFASEFGLTVTAIDRTRRAVVLEGTLDDLARAFDAQMALYAADDGTTYRAQQGALSVPADLGAVITGVFGMDERAQARAQFRRLQAAAGTAGYSPVAVADAYGYPAGTDGTGQAVGLIELGGGFRAEDLSAYFTGLGVASPSVTAVGVDGGANSPGAANGPDGEVMLDIEVVGAIAPRARIYVYFAPNTDQGFIDAVSTAVHDTTNTPSVVSISWGGPESTWTAQAMQQMEQVFIEAAALGVTVTVAAGDGGSTDGATDGAQHVDFPASAPHSLACGGTSLALSGTAVSSETVWNDLASGHGATGGGVSDQFQLPAYQTSAKVPPSANPGGHVGRGVPDVAGDADPQTGYTVRVDGQDTVIGGTSAVAPLWAALVARLNQALGRKVGDLHPALYGAPGAFRDITSGSNGAYQAGGGWDACTGLGSPDGTALLAALKNG
ncbi:MAG: S53 family peptidase [Acidimicrobiales bacterium]